MKTIASILPRWLPAVFVMLAIFVLSSQPGDDLPDFQSWDYLVKKSAHMLGYGLLARSYLYLLGESRRRGWLAWGMTLAYAMTDEFHQSFVPGRSASIIDVVVFDNLGGAISLWLAGRAGRRLSRK